MNVAIIGAGTLGQRWTEIVSSSTNAKVQAFVDPLIGSEKAPAWLAQYPETPKLKTIAELKDTRIEAAIITAFSPAHAEAVEQSLAHNYHVLVEKPFVTNRADAERLVQLAEQKKRKLMVSQNYRFFPGPLAVRKIVENKSMGEIHSVIGQFWCDWPGKPYQHAMEHVMGLEMAIHHFDLVRFMFGANARQGNLSEWNPKGSQYRSGGAVEGLFLMQSPIKDFSFLYSGSLVSKLPSTPWAGFWRFEFDDGTLVASIVEGKYGLFRFHGNRHEFIAPFGEDSMAYDKSFYHFYESIKKDREPGPSGSDNLESLRMVLSFVN